MAGISSTNGIQQVAWLCLVLVLSQGTVHAGLLQLQSLNDDTVLTGTAGEPEPIDVTTDTGSFASGDEIRLRLDGTSNCLDQNTLPYTSLVFANGVGWTQTINGIPQAVNTLTVLQADAGDYQVCVKPVGTSEFVLPVNDPSPRASFRDAMAPSFVSVSISPDVYVQNKSMAEVGDLVTISFSTNKPVQTAEATIAGIAATVEVLDAANKQFRATITVPPGLVPHNFPWSLKVTDAFGNVRTTDVSTDGTSIDMRCDFGNPLTSWTAGSGFVDDGNNFLSLEAPTVYNFVSFDSITGPDTSLATMRQNTSLYAMRVAGTIRLEGDVVLRIEDRGCPPDSSGRKPADPKVVPTAVRKLRHEPDATSTIVRWQAPLDNGGNAILDYRLVVKQSNVIIRTEFPSSNTFEVTGLAAATPYTFEVAARNSLGYGPVATLAVTTLPAAPQVLSLVASGDNNPVFSSGDKIQINFNIPTNQPSVANQVLIDDLLSFSSSIGPAYTAVWTSPTRLTITIVKTGSASPNIGVLTVTILKKGGVQNADQTSKFSDSLSAPLSGSWGNAAEAALAFALSPILLAQDTNSSLGTTVTAPGTLRVEAVLGDARFGRLRSHNGALNAAALNFTGSASEITATLATIRFVPSVKFFGSTGILFTVYDAAGSVLDAGTLAITVNMTNANPVWLASSNSSLLLDVPYNLKLAFSDADNAAAISYSQVLNDVVEVTIATSQGAFSIFNSGVTTAGVEVVPAPGSSSATFKFTGRQQSVLLALDALRYATTARASEGLTVTFTGTVSDLGHVTFQPRTASFSTERTIECTSTVPAPGLTAAVLSRSSLTLVLEFARPVFWFSSLSNVANCDGISIAGSSLTGVDLVTCVIDSNTLTVQNFFASSAATAIGTTAQVSVGANVYKRCVLGGGNSALTSTASVVGTAPTPTVFLQTSAEVSACEDIDVSYTVGSGAKLESLVWTLITSEALVNYTLPTVSPANTAGELVIPASALGTAPNITITLTAVTALGGSSSLSRVVQRSAAALPRVTISTFDASYPLDAPIDIGATVQQSKCSGSGASSPAQFAWTITPTPANVNSIDLTKSSVYVAPRLLAPGTYKFAVIATIGNAVASASVPVVVTPLGVSAVVLGGERTVRQPFATVVDGSLSRNLDNPDSTAGLTYAWSCVDDATDLPCVDLSNINLVFPQTAKITVNTSRLTTGKKCFTLAVKLNALTASASECIIIQPADDTASGLFTAQISAPLDIEVDSIVRLAFENTNLDFSQSVLSRKTFIWSSPNLNLTALAVGSDNALTKRTLVLNRAGNRVFVPGAVYEIQLQVDNAIARARLRVNQGPVGGQLVASVLTGTRRSTVFQFSVAGVVSTALPLTYKFFRVRGTKRAVFARTLRSLASRTLSVIGNNTIGVEITDSNGQATILTTSVTVTVPPNLAMARETVLAIRQELRDALSQAKDSGDFQSLLTATDDAICTPSLLNDGTATTASLATLTQQCLSALCDIGSSLPVEGVDSVLGCVADMTLDNLNQGGIEKGVCLLEKLVDRFNYEDVSKLLRGFDGAWASVSRLILAEFQVRRNRGWSNTTAVLDQSQPVQISKTVSLLRRVVAKIASSSNTVTANLLQSLTGISLQMEPAPSAGAYMNLLSTIPTLSATLLAHPDESYVFPETADASSSVVGYLSRSYENNIANRTFSADGTTATVTYPLATALVNSPNTLDTWVQFSSGNALPTTLRDDAHPLIYASEPISPVISVSSVRNGVLVAANDPALQVTFSTVDSTFPDCGTDCQVERHCFYWDNAIQAWRNMPIALTTRTATSVTCQVTTNPSIVTAHSIQVPAVLPTSSSFSALFITVIVLAVILFILTVIGVDQFYRYRKRKADEQRRRAQWKTETGAVPPSSSLSSPAIQLSFSQQSMLHDQSDRRKSGAQGIIPSSSMDGAVSMGAGSALSMGGPAPIRRGDSTLSNIVQMYDILAPPDSSRLANLKPPELQDHHSVSEAEPGTVTVIPLDHVEEMYRQLDANEQKQQREQLPGFESRSSLLLSSMASVSNLLAAARSTKEEPRAPKPERQPSKIIVTPPEGPAGAPASSAGLVQSSSAFDIELVEQHQAAEPEPEATPPQPAASSSLMQETGAPGTVAAIAAFGDTNSTLYPSTTTTDLQAPQLTGSASEQSVIPPGQWESIEMPAAAEPAGADSAAPIQADDVELAVAAVAMVEAAPAGAAAASEAFSEGQIAQEPVQEARPEEEEEEFEY